MKQMMIQSKQKGFTLLELLVVITLLAVLSVGALIAYEGIGDNAQATAAANNTAGVDRAIRNFRAVSLTYPDQWDNLSASATAAPYSTTQMAAATQAAFGDWSVATNAATKSAVVAAFNAVGITAIQQMAANATTTGVAPNQQHNEGANSPNALQELLSTAAWTHVAVLPSHDAVAPGVGLCNAGTAPINVAYNGTAVLNNNKMNAIHDSLEADECQLVIALGFGHDAAHGTATSPAAIVTAASYSSKNVNPATNYARYIALFHMGTDGNDDLNIDATEINTKARLLGIVDTEGNPIDANIAKATAVN